MGSAYLAEAGLLDGGDGTTHWARAADFALRYPKVRWRPEMMITESGGLLCSGGVASSIDVSLYLVEKLAGHEIAVQTAKSLLLNMPRASQTGYAMLPLSPPHDDAKIHAAEAYIQANHRDDLSADAMTKRFGMSASTFLRRFKAATGHLPGAYVQAVRVEAAKVLLERERLPVRAVSAAVGYEDVSFFRNLFKRVTGMNPAEYRNNFGALPVRGMDGTATRKAR
jgi:transcriptional regulator GlxA family with amidase domain